MGYLVRKAVSKRGVRGSGRLGVGFWSADIWNKEFLKHGREPAVSRFQTRGATWRQSAETLTCPGKTLGEKSLFSCTSLFGVMLNFSAMLLRESFGPTCNQKYFSPKIIRWLFRGCGQCCVTHRILHRPWWPLLLQLWLTVNFTPIACRCKDGRGLNSKTKENFTSTSQKYFFQDQNDVF